MRSPLSSFKELNIKMKIGLTSLIVLGFFQPAIRQLPDNRTSAQRGIKQFVGKSSLIIRSLIKVYKSGDNELVLTVVGGPISRRRIRTLHQKTSLLRYSICSIKVNQVHNSTKLDSEMTKEFYENINKYIDQKLSEKDSQKIS